LRFEGKTTHPSERIAHVVKIALLVMPVVSNGVETKPSKAGNGAEKDRSQERIHYRGDRKASNCVIQVMEQFGITNARCFYERLTRDSQQYGE